jgi:vancomycin resistance protein YoaR
VRKFAFVFLLLISLPLLTAFTGEDCITVDFGDGQIKLDDRILQSGWFNYGAKNRATGGKTLRERVENMPPDANFIDAFPDIIQFINKVATRYEIKPYDGNVIFYPNAGQKFAVVNQSSGKTLNRKKLYADILSALKQSGRAFIKAEYAAVPPTEKEKITASIVKRGEFFTHFEPNRAREHNIALSAAAFNGLTVNPGEEVSFNATVGKRTEARGYRKAKIIIDGEYAEGIGGGVCQTSTTVFNAAVQSGLHITQSHNHTLHSSYVPLGADAMVSSNYDLKFVNNTGAPIYFETEIKNNNVFVRIYGKTKGSDIRYRLSFVTTKEIPPIEILDEEAGIGQNILNDYKLNPQFFTKEVTRPGESGYAVTTYIETYKGSRLLSKKILRKSIYKSRPTKFRPAAVLLPLTHNYQLIGERPAAVSQSFIF